MARGAPRTRAELGKEITARWPDVDADSLGYAMYAPPTVHVMPRGLPAGYEAASSPDRVG